MDCSAQIECERKHIICERRKSVAYDLRMGWKSVLHGQRRSLDRLRMGFLGLGFEALKLDFLDDGRDIGEINLLGGGFDNGIQFARESTLARS
jgi:hypothetical protein